MGAALLAQAKGFDVFVSDKGVISDVHKKELDAAGVAYEQGGHSIDKLLGATTIVKSPGIPDHIPMIQKLHSAGIDLISEIEFAARHTKGKIVAITGSNGKTTTTALTGYIFKKAEVDVAIVGNIGKSFARQVAEEDKSIYVVEVSSFQLDGVKDFRADVAVLLNITPDHLDRYEYDFAKYVASKFRITLNQTSEQSFVYNADDEAISGYMRHNKIASKCIPFSLEKEVAQGAWANTEEFFININKMVFSMSISELGLRGQHNVYNSMASSIVGKIFDLRNEKIRESLTDFKNLEHRMEFVAKIKGVEYINDSKATNVNSTWFALESMEKPTIWIVGGVDKGNDYAPLVDLVNDKVKAIICLGNDNLKIHQAFSSAADLIVNTSTIDEAVDLANHLGVDGDAVLLSPACASFDLFENYEDRGRQFKGRVRLI